MNIMEYTSDKIDNEITLLPYLLKMFSMFQMSFWYDNEPDDQNYVKIISIKGVVIVKNKQVYL